jgi:pyridoxamine 5'-phosphate oxidase
MNVAPEKTAREPLAPHYNDLAGSLQAAKAMLARGVADRRASCHTPTIATIGTDGRPRLRIVVLRAFDPAQVILRFNTDTRSEKWAELQRDPRISLHAYDPGAKVQLRIDGLASLHRDDEMAQASWDASRSFSRACYGVLPGPGSAMEAGDAFTLPASPDEIEAGRAFFGTVRIKAHSIEWLYLAHAGHRRALFAPGEGGWRGRWLTP